MTLKVNERAIEWTLIGSSRLPSRPGTGGVPAVNQSVANIIYGEPTQWRCLGWSVFIVLALVIMIAGQSRKPVTS
jgi:hypothetical protein